MRSLSIASAIGRDLSGLRVLTRGLRAFEDAGIEIIAAHQTPRNVDVQFVLSRGDLKPAIRALHSGLLRPQEVRTERKAA